MKRIVRSLVVATVCTASLLAPHAPTHAATNSCGSDTLLLNATGGGNVTILVSGSYSGSEILNAWHYHILWGNLTSGASYDYDRNSPSGYWGSKSFKDTTGANTGAGNVQVNLTNVVVYYYSGSDYKFCDLPNVTANLNVR